ncbi:MAG TPA: hypothetical protein VK666_11150, partial [Chryseolinea sp.]|nr:hypothetical protein [Chryseolinea sp.]
MSKTTLCLILFVLVLCRLSVNAQTTKPEVVSIAPNVDSVGLYDKFEAKLTIKATFVNPFDPEDID